MEVRQNEGNFILSNKAEFLLEVREKGFVQWVTAKRVVIVVCCSWDFFFFLEATVDATVQTGIASLYPSSKVSVVIRTDTFLKVKDDRTKVHFNFFFFIIAMLSFFSLFLYSTKRA